MLDLQIVILGIVLVILVTNALTGFSRGLWRTLLRLATLLVSCVVAFFLSKALAGTLAQNAIVFLETAMASSEDLAELIEFWNANPAFASAAQTVIVLIVPPLLFLATYIALKCVTLILYWILAGVLSIPKAKGKPLMRLAGLGVGLVIALIGVLVFVTPVLGYSNLVGTVIDNVGEGEEPDPTLVEMHTYLDPITTAPIASQVYNTLGAPTFSGLTTTEWEGEEVALESEIDAVLVVADGLSTMTGNSEGIAGFGNEEAAALDSMAEGVGDSRLLSVLAADIFKNASTAWLGGETFLGVAAPATGDANATIILKGFLTVLSTSTPETVGADLGFVADMVELLAKHEMFALLGEGTEEGAFVRKLAESDFLDEALVLLHANERMQPMLKALSDVGTRMLVEQLGVPDNYLEEHLELMDTMSEIVKDAADENGNLNKEVLATELGTALEEYEVVLEPAAVDLIATGFAEEFTAEELTTLTPDEIAERLVAHFAEVGAIGAMAEQLPQE